MRRETYHDVVNSFVRAAKVQADSTDFARPDALAIAATLLNAVPLLNNDNDPSGEIRSHLAVEAACGLLRNLPL